MNNLYITYIFIVLHFIIYRHYITQTPLHILISELPSSGNCLMKSVNGNREQKNAKLINT